jgi:hypothetical protein
LPIHLERRNLIGDKIMIDGNSACGLGALFMLVPQLLLGIQLHLQPQL